MELKLFQIKETICVNLKILNELLFIKKNKTLYLIDNIHYY